jgi:hypothetical protein
VYERTQAVFGRLDGYSYEHIYIDNASTDGTVWVLRAIVARDKHVKVNWRAEQAIRPAVVNRKVSGGNRSDRGAETQQVLASVVRTARQRGCNATDVLGEILHAPQPTVSPTLRASAATESPR